MDVPRALLIDLDNCPRQIESLPQALERYTRVIACHGGGGEPKVPLGLVAFLADAIHDGRLQIVAMPRNGKNAADFGLAFWAGRLAAEMPDDTEFLVLSEDCDLDHVVDMLKSAGCLARRVGGSRAPAAASPGEPDHAAADEYWEVHLSSVPARPATKKTLLKSIKNYFKSRQKGISPQRVLASLVDRGVVSFEQQGKVRYPLDGTEDPALVAAEFEDEIPF